MIRPLAVAALALLTAACATPRTVSAPEGPVKVGIIAINDFHGNLEPPVAGSGGAAHLASAIDRVRAGYRYSVTVSAGDLIGASPLVSSLFLDEPTVEVMNRMKLDFNAVGNHEFDSGTAELLRKQNGGCGKFTSRQPCALERFAGARFRFLAANVKFKNGKGTLFPGTALRSFGEGGRKVTLGFIGMTLEGTSALVSAGGVKDVTFADEAETANALVPQLKAKGADAIVLLIHEGGAQLGGTRFPNGCDGFDGAIREIAAALDPRIDLVVSGHTHKAYVCTGPQIGLTRPLLLTSAGMGGSLVTEIVLDVDPTTRRVVSSKATNLAVVHASDPSTDIADYVSHYVEAARPIAERLVGKLSAPAARGEDGLGGALGNLVADAQLAATRADGAQIALTNPFGLRAPLAPKPDGSVNYGAIFPVQPFANMLVTLDLTGAQIKAALEQGFVTKGREQALAASQGFAWSYDSDSPVGDRVVAMTLNGAPIDPASHYKVTVNTFLAGGGDGFTVFTQGKAVAPITVNDLDALEAWISAAPVREVPQEERAIAK